ncbi:unnamed protein product [Larinioides sclopetarius]|uniref:THAP-type domain-containing protein n=1 Tax=Larinioides sclopetarius TaxID=280406 RepID=A0AAV2BTP8_9ARAC
MNPRAVKGRHSSRRQYYHGVLIPCKCSVPACRGNYDEANKVAVFSFLNDENLRAQWLRAIPRKDFKMAACPTLETSIAETSISLLHHSTFRGAISGGEKIARVALRTGDT